MSAVGQNRKCADLAVSQKRRLCDVWGMALLSRIPRFPILGILEIGGIDAKSRSQELSEKAAEERRRRRDWLLPFMQNSQPKTAGKRGPASRGVAHAQRRENAWQSKWRGGAM